MKKIGFLILFSLIFVSCSESLSEDEDKKVTKAIKGKPIYVVGTGKKVPAQSYEVLSEEGLTEKDEEQLHKSVLNGRIISKDYDIQLKKYKITLAYTAPKDNLLVAGNMIFDSNAELDKFLKKTIKESTTSTKCVFRKRSLFGKGVCQKYEMKTKENASEIEADIKNKYKSIKTVKKGEEVKLEHILTIMTEKISDKQKKSVHLQRS